MDKYIVNSNLIGYTELNLVEDNVENITDSIINIIINSDDLKISDYYFSIKTLVKNCNKVVLIGTSKSDNFDILASLLVSLDKYDIYLVAEESDITVNYLETCEEREPSYLEVQNYIGGDITASESIVSILFNIENLIEDGNIDDLKEFIEENLKTIQNMSNAINKMKKYADIKYSKELVNKVNEAVERAKNFEEKSVDTSNKLKELKEENEALTETIDEINKSKKELEDNIKELRDKLDTGVSVINCFDSINLNTVKNKIQRVIYFKEVSYVNYTNSMITALVEILNALGMRTKLVIYDNSTSMFDYYQKMHMSIVNTGNYVANRKTVNGPNPFVLSEPSNSITNDIISKEDGYDVLIIYDKTHTYENILFGNIVTRLIVANSSKEFKENMAKLKFNKISDLVITRENSSLINDEDIKGCVLDIQTIPEFESASESSKIHRFKKLDTKNNGKILNKIMDKANILSINK